MKSSSQFNFYVTLLDRFQSYISSDVIYNQYYGFAENPSKSEEEFEVEQFNSLIDSINRVPFTSEAADKGTAFNHLVDWIVTKDKPEEIEATKDNYGGIIVTYEGQEFVFPSIVAKQVADYCEGALVQERVSADMETKYGTVNIYGYVDVIKSFSVIDIKTTKKYSAFKFRNNWQHIAYPFCLRESGVEVDTFEYLVTDFRDVYHEVYNYKAEYQNQLLLHVERFIEFLRDNESLITDEKIWPTRNALVLQE